MLYLQRGAMRFEDVSKLAGITGGDDDWAAGATLADIDNDGDLDIYVCNYDAPNQLFLNPGQEGEPFVEAAAAWGLDLVDASLMPTFADYDCDGDLDLFVLTNRYTDARGRPETPPVRVAADNRPEVLAEYQRFYRLRQTGPRSWTIDNTGRPDYLFRNDGGRFTDVTRRAGLAEYAGHGLSATWWDYDGDGWPDLHVGNDFTDADRLYRNNGDGTFTDVAAAALPFTSWSTMGADAGDLNGDGRLDLITGDMANTTHYKAKTSMGEMGDRQWFLENAWPRQIMRNVVFLNTGTGHFSEAGFISGLAKSDWTWAVKIADFDNDGRNDVYFTNGMSRNFVNADVPITDESRVGQTEWALFEDTPPLLETNVAFRNDGAMRFDKVADEWGLAHLGMSYAAAYGDLDGDGDLDLVVNNLGEPAHIYQNNSDGGHRVVIELRGTRSNRQGMGAVVRLTSGGGVQVRQATPATGFLSTNDNKLHFGLGESTLIDRLEVYWPSGQQQVFEDVGANQRLVVSEPPGRARPGPIVDPEQPLLAAADSRDLGLRFTHAENQYDDFQDQPLLPGRLSQLGGGIACGDVDGDGHDDVYFCGAAGQGGRLLVWRRGGYQRQSGPWREHVWHEDMAALFFDADADNDLDLLVTSGSYEYPRGDERQYDRLYLNDGSGEFIAAVDALPPLGEASGPAAVADIDLDGDLDLFIGGRVVPGAYPTAPRSRLLRNDGGVFTDITDTYAAPLRHVGMVTSATWANINNAAQPELLLSLEWGPIKCFELTPGGLAERTEAAGLGGRVGWFNSVTPCDVDGDGSLDLIALNVGLNTKYGRATAARPAHLFYGDFDGQGVRRLVEAKPGTDHDLLPVRGFS